MADLVARHAQSVVAEALADTRVVLVNGARQSGKSTLTRPATAGHADTAVKLLDDPTRSSSCSTIRPPTGPPWTTRPPSSNTTG